MVGEKGNEEVVRLVAESGASIIRHDSKERAVLPQAVGVLECGVEKKHNEVVQLLLGQSVDGVDGNQTSAERERSGWWCTSRASLYWGCY